MSVKYLVEGVNTFLTLYTRKFEPGVSANDEINSLNLSHV